MSHPLLGLEIEQLRRESQGYLMHNESDERYALFLSGFFATMGYYASSNRKVLIAVAEKLADGKPGGDGW